MRRRNWVHSAWAGTAAGREATTEYQGGGDQELDPMLIEHYLCNDHEKDNDYSFEDDNHDDDEGSGK